MLSLTIYYSLHPFHYLSATRPDFCVLALSGSVPSLLRSRSLLVACPSVLHSHLSRQRDLHYYILTLSRFSFCASFPGCDSKIWLYELKNSNALYRDDG
ncbi:unnamed protein product [Sphenostylis stenocarpa]|uniref:Uncharacterized protein n=1 Tax=Sphenostylis stenocarpa TaxID=92480 RepID=A0AA86SL51_9FABA|nr:unnamed protein product [Sphenostylis stenocarpa]